MPLTMIVKWMLCVFYVSEWVGMLPENYGDMISHVTYDRGMIIIVMDKWVHSNIAVDSSLFCGIDFYANNFKWVYSVGS